MPSSLDDLLHCSIDPRQEIRTEAEKNLLQARETNLPDFLKALTDVLCSEEKKQSIRQVAAILIKNTISAKDKVIDDANAQAWLHLPLEYSNYIKGKILAIIETPDTLVSNASCQVLSKLAKIELPRNLWPDFLQSLMAMVTGRNKFAITAALTCLGYISEEMADSFQQCNVKLLTEQQSNQILTAVVQGMCDESDSVKVAATKALHYAILFAEQNFANKNERDYIFHVLCENCESTNMEVQMNALECLLQIASEFYEYLEEYIGRIGPLTWAVINTRHEQVAIPALEFWSTICDVEIECEREMQPKKRSAKYIEQAMQHFLPILLETLSCHESEDCEIDSWTLAMAAGTCLSLCAQLFDENIMHQVIQFADKNFCDADWRRREAAVLAFGSVMNVKRFQQLSGFAEASFRNLCQTLNDNSVAVRDTAAWAIGRIISVFSGSIIPMLQVSGNDSSEQSPLSLIVSHLTDCPRVAANVCWILNELATHAINLKRPLNPNSSHPEIIESPLDQIFKELCDALVNVSERCDADERNLRSASFTALETLIRSVGTACHDTMYHLYMYLLDRLERTLYVDRSESIVSLQDSICGCLQAIIPEIGNKIVNLVEATWRCLKKILQNSIPCGLSEDALLTVSALANALQMQFEPIMQEFSNILVTGLRKMDEIMTCKVCIELVGDVSRALESSFLQYSEDILLALYAILKDTTADRSLKPGVMVAVSDVAMAIQEGFEKYLEPFMRLLGHASSTRIDEGPVDNEEWVWYVVELREGILQAYSGIVYGLRDGNLLDHLATYVPGMLELIKLITETDPSYVSDTNLVSAIALVGDLLNSFGTSFSDYLFKTDLVSKLLEQADQVKLNGEADASECRKKADWLRQILRPYEVNLKS